MISKTHSPFLLKDVRRWPKSDRHNHGLLGGHRGYLEKKLSIRLNPFLRGKEGIPGLNSWITDVYRPVMALPGAFEAAIEAAFVQAVHDGIVVLEMSIDALAGSLFNRTPADVIAILKSKHREFAPSIDFRPELGFPRTVPVNLLLKAFDSYMGENYFKAIDLYDDESARSPEQFRELYRLAKQAGLRCKAHAGEFGTAESVRHAVETLELDAVQHGIGAAGSSEVMRWLASNGITLNICPASNLRLKRVQNYRSHPIRILYDHGVKVTINTDDALVFGVGVSEQMVRLVRCGLFSLDEMEEIRMNGLGS